MISYKDLDENIKGVIFELDNVIFPEKDYDLQVYYLFANFLEYLEQFPPANDVIEFMNKRYLAHGKENIFEEVVKAFGIDNKYKENLALLNTNAKLPLKLLIFEEISNLLKELVVNKKQIFILTKGIAKQQFNKITQTDWQGLEKYLKVYFVEEFEGDYSVALSELLAQNQLAVDELVFVGATLEDTQLAAQNNLKTLLVNDIQ